ncbi:MAG: hypothetical protein P4N60_02065 [Verrucomicrobiae bacterium]|nr:hypothetical protein [Verrucomicrobiae bacterium]
MNCSTHMTQSSHKPFGSSTRWLGIFGWLCLVLVRPALATDALWPPADQVGANFNYSVPGNPPPTIDATAFYNQSEFRIDFNAFTANPQMFETWNTLFYTNNGLMLANSPLTTNGLILNQSKGCGFNFDYQISSSGFHAMADTFYNAGQIRCDSTNESNNIFDAGSGFTFFLLSSIGECLVSATNIQSSGSIVVGADGLIKLNSQHTDLSYGTLAVEQPIDTVASIFGNIFFANFFNFGQTIPNFTAVGGFGTDTNAEWEPFFDLTPTNAVTSYPFAFALTNTTPYFDIRQVGPSNVVVRAVFIQDDSDTNQVTYKVYFTNSVFGPGSANIEWTGLHQDTASGENLNNYLYLNDDYVLGASTNLFLVNGVPDNFSLSQTSVQIPLGTPVTNGFPTGFAFEPIGGIVNPYAYFTGTFLSSSIATNASTVNPSGALTNLPGKILISASGSLNLANVQISGQNYMSLSAPNQFDGSIGANIISPYSDINLGATNGFLTITNLLAGSVPNFSGNLTAWSTRWTNTDAITGFNYDYRVLVVASSFVPASKSWVQTLTLHATNSVVISDVFNVFKSLSVDAQNLTTTTNAFGNGATSADGELNWFGPSVLNAAQFPNLRSVTNNGAIRAANLAVFGGSSSVYGAFINNGIVADQGTTIWTTNFFNSGMITSGGGSFALQAQTATMTNGVVSAAGDLTITAPSLIVNNVNLQAGRMIQLTASNLLTDLGGTNAYWTVGYLGVSGIDSGFNLPVKPLVGDLLGTTVTNIAPAGKIINNLWAAQDRGYANTGYANNVGVGQLVLDVKGATARLNFSGIGTNFTTNAIYVDCLQLHHFASYTNRVGTNLPALTFNTNLVIYYAQALIDDGSSVAEKINHFNSDHLRWVPTYVGIFSSTNLIYPDGTTNLVNAALASSPDIDSDGDGTANNTDPSPILTPNQLNFVITVTNVPPKSARLQWVTVGNGTNYVYYKTNLLSPNWLPLNNFKNFYYDPGQAGTNGLHTNWFPSPFGYPYPPSPVWIYDPVTNMPHFYRIMVQPYLTGPNP